MYDLETPLHMAADKGYDTTVAALTRRKFNPLRLRMGYAQRSGLGITGTRLNAEMHLPLRRDNYLAVARNCRPRGKPKRALTAGMNSAIGGVRSCFGGTVVLPCPILLLHA